MEQTLLAYGLLKEIVTTIMVLSTNMKALIGSCIDDTDFFDIVSRVLQEDTLAPFLFIIYLDYVL